MTGNWRIMLRGRTTVECAVLTADGLEHRTKYVETADGASAVLVAPEEVVTADVVDVGSGAFRTARIAPPFERARLVRHMEQVDPVEFV